MLLRVQSCVRGHAAWTRARNGRGGLLAVWRARSPGQRAANPAPLSPDADPRPLPRHAQFGCTDPSQVLKEVMQCQKAFPQAYVRLIAYDNQRQVQIMGFLVQRPRNATDYCDLPKRSVA